MCVRLCKYNCNYVRNQSQALVLLLGVCCGNTVSEMVHRWHSISVRLYDSELSLIINSLGLFPSPFPIAIMTSSQLSINQCSMHLVLINLDGNSVPSIKEETVAIGILKCPLTSIP